MTVDYSVPSGGYFCRVHGVELLSTEQVERVEARMHDLVQEDLPIKREVVSLDEARAYFKTKHYDDKLQLLKYRNKPDLVLYQLEKHRDYHHGYMVPSTGFIKSLNWFRRRRIHPSVSSAKYSHETTSYAAIHQIARHISSVW
jgi:uridine kinase